MGILSPIDEVRKAYATRVYPHGESSNTSRLTESQVIEAYNLIAAGKGTRTVAKQFGISRGALLAVVRGKTWRHLNLPALPPRPTAPKRCHRPRID